MHRALLCCAALLGSLALGCGASTPSLPGPGYDMQVRVNQATLQEGPLLDNPQNAQGPTVTQLLRSQTTVARGEWGIKLSGRVSPGAVAVHIAAQGDPNHWVVPAKGFDFTYPKELQWSTYINVSPSAAAGQRLRVNLRAVDAQGQMGPIRYLDFDLAPYPPPSPLVVALDWNRAVDFDLIVQTPDGQLFGPAKRSDLTGAGQEPTAIYAFDSNQECRIDARNHEDLVWQKPPAPGLYRVFVDLYSNCAEPASNYKVHVMRDGAPWRWQSGVQYAIDASWPPTPEDPPGELVMEFHIP